MQSFVEALTTRSRADDIFRRHDYFPKISSETSEGGTNPDPGPWIFSSERGKRQRDPAYPPLAGPDVPPNQV